MSSFQLSGSYAGISIAYSVLRMAWTISMVHRTTFMGSPIGGRAQADVGSSSAPDEGWTGGCDILVQFHPVDSIRVSGCVGPANAEGWELW